MHEITLVLLIAVLAGVITYKRSKFTRFAGSGLLTYVALFIYWNLGVYINGGYEPEMILGWLLVSTIANLVVVPLAYYVGYLLLRYKGKVT